MAARHHLELLDSVVDAYSASSFGYGCAGPQSMPRCKMLVSPTASPVPRVLLAEDSRPCQEFVRIVLKQAGFAVDIVGNGAEAIEALSKTDYALVLMDCLMPIMGGAETTRLIRSGATNARNPEIPIIAITANAFQENAETCKLAGMNDYIS